MCQGTTLLVAEKLIALKGHGFSRAVNAAKHWRALQAAEKLVELASIGCFVSGHDFSRAANVPKEPRGFSP
jgi:hypothetical protein